jgi:hypothetical protein
MMATYRTTAFENMPPQQSITVCGTGQTARDIIRQTLRRKPDARYIFQKDGRNIIIIRVS